MTRQELLQIAKPILFNTPMVGAILDNRKTATRRPLKIKYKDDEYGFQIITNAGTGEFVGVEMTDEDECGIFTDGTVRHVTQPCYRGDYLYVRETWCDFPNGAYHYKADSGTKIDEHFHQLTDTKWRPSIHMPKEAARLFLRVTDVQMEQLQGISPEQCTKEGMTEKQKAVLDKEEYWYWFKELWDSTIKKQDLDDYGWNANPWVWVIEFERLEVRT